jgi:hypothetical protein
MVAARAAWADPAYADRMHRNLDLLIVIGCLLVAVALLLTMLR